MGFNAAFVFICVLKATFGAGCFWHVEDLLDKTLGVNATAVGYIGGRTQNPTYEDVCTNMTGHVEAVEIDYDPNKISYEDLLDVFWNNHDPTTPNRQGPDIGTQYRSAIFYHTSEQKKIAEKSRENKNEHSRRPIVTEIVPASNFYKAEEYHQKYFQKHGFS